jgi:hypothetical protein
MSWNVEFSDEFKWWYERQLSEVQEEAVDRVVEALVEHGPALTRPISDLVLGSKIPHLKELRAGSIRVLYAFDPRRTAYLILGGDKRGEWADWYPAAIAQAERIWDGYIEELVEEGVLPG